MALYHDAIITPSKSEVLADWVPTQAWSPASGEVDPIGAFRFDDPEGQVGLETHLVRMDGVVLHVPLTYRAEPLAGAEHGLIGEVEHSALGTRWVYDGLADARYVLMLAAVAMTGQGEALGMVQYDGKWHLAPATVRIVGGGWSQERAGVDGFAAESIEGPEVTYSNDRFDLTVYRRPASQAQDSLALSATWEAQPEPVLLAMVSVR